MGAIRRPDKSWVFFNTPENLRALKQKQIQLVHLRLMKYGAVLLEEQLGTMLELQRAGKILHVSLRSVTRAELEVGLKSGAIATVINMCSYAQHTTVKLPYGTNPGGEVVRDLCEQHGILPFLFFSLVPGLPSAGNKLLEMVKKHNVTEAQIDAGLLQNSPWILPILGTSSLAHLRENLKAAAIKLSAEGMVYLS